VNTRHLNLHVKSPLANDLASRFGRRVPDKNGEVDPTIFPIVSDMQLGA
jgi:hypothetical protein